MGKALCVEAPCKINVHLRVKDRRSDGFHDLESVFLALSWGDTLRVELVDGEPGDEIRLDAKIPLGEPLPPGRNIIRRAAALFRDRTGFKGALRFTLEKRVPLGAGLGGGSSDGASALLALNALTGAGLSGEVLRGMAERLGSDVPFFLSGGAALVTGRGERIRNIEPPRDIRVVLVNPGFSSGTAEAFRLLDRYREAPDVLNDGARQRPGAVSLPEEVLIGALGGDPARWPYGNDFLPVLLACGSGEVRGAYNGILGDLKVLGADFSGLSGAGSTCFGIFTDKEKAVRAVKSLSMVWNCVHLTFPLARSGNAVLE